MYFASFEIENFKGIEKVKLDLTDQPANQIHTLVGLNESGKTTILEAISAFGNDSAPLEEALFEGMHKSSPIQDFVPKNKKSNFSESIVLKATLVFEAGEKEKLAKYLQQTSDIVLDCDKIKDELIIEKIFEFEDSIHQRTRNNWDINFVARKTRGSVYRKYSIYTSEAKKALAFIKYNMIPSISYFPTFLFDFPEKIYLDETDHESRTNQYYRNIIQDILNSLDENLNVQKHIVDRVYEEREREDGKIWWILNPFLYSGDTKAQIDSVLFKIGDKITREVFQTWNEIFKRKITHKNIFVNFGIEQDSEEEEEEQRVYLEFYLKDGTQQFSITERSLGFRWFFCFLLFTQFRSFRKADKKTLFLFDEPASNLHSGAQNQLLESFPKITSDKCSIIYSTHSHHMINPKWLENTFIVENEGIDYDDSEQMYSYASSKDTNIKIEKYKSFVGQNPDKVTYFQPILEKLQYRPSALENIPDVVMLEGKHDFYTYNYFKSVILKSKVNVNFLPGVGSGKLEELIALYLGWGKNFIILLDSDKAGKEAQKKYQEEWLLPSNVVYTYEDINPNWKSKKLESFITEQDKNKIKQEILADTEKTKINNKKLTKKELARFLQEKYAAEESYTFSPQTTKDFTSIIKFCAEAITPKNIKKKDKKKAA